MTLDVRPDTLDVPAPPDAGGQGTEGTDASAAVPESAAPGPEPSGSGALAGLLDWPGWLLPLFTSRDDMSRAAVRRSAAIHGYVGSNGGGKSLAMVHDTLPSLMAGRRVLSTVRLLDYRDPRPCPGGSRCDDPDNHYVTRTTVTMVDLPDFPPGNGLGVHVDTRQTGEVHGCAHPLYVPFVSFRQLFDWRDGDVLMDEVTGIASSRQSQSLPPQIANMLVQLRRRDVLLRWTAPNWSRADLIVREVTQAVTDCSGLHSIERTATDGTARTWRDRRLFHWWTYDTREYDEWTAHRAEETPPFCKQRFWRPGSVTELTYDTMDAVSMLGAAADEGGRCITCGGARQKEPCSCADHVARVEARKAAAAALRPRRGRDPDA